MQEKLNHKTPVLLGEAARIDRIDDILGDVVAGLMTRDDARLALRAIGIKGYEILPTVRDWKRRSMVVNGMDTATFAAWLSH